METKMKTKMKTWTIDEMIAEGPCRQPFDYQSTEVLQVFWAGQESLSLLDLLRHPDIPTADRIWVALRPSALPTDIKQAWLDTIIARVITEHALSCSIPLVVEWAKDWLSGKNRSRAAALAARAEAARAAEEAAWAAARGARAAARAALAADVADAAARAARAAARAAQERQQQLDDLINLITEKQGNKYANH